MTEDHSEQYEERSAIYEYDAGMTRAAAERRAWADIEFKINRSRGDDTKRTDKRDHGQGL